MSEENPFPDRTSVVRRLQDSSKYIEDSLDDIRHPAIDLMTFLVSRHFYRIKLFFALQPFGCDMEFVVLPVGRIALSYS